MQLRLPLLQEAHHELSTIAARTCFLVSSILNLSNCPTVPPTREMCHQFDLRALSKVLQCFGNCNWQTVAQCQSDRLENLNSCVAHVRVVK
jgi:hypothetical protein